MPSSYQFLKVRGTRRIAVGSRCKVELNHEDSETVTHCQCNGSQIPSSSQRRWHWQELFNRQSEGGDGTGTDCAFSEPLKLTRTKLKLTRTKLKLNGNPDLKAWELLVLEHMRQDRTVQAEAVQVGEGAHGVGQNIMQG